MKHIIPAILIIAVIVGGSLFIASDDEPQVKIITPAPDYMNDDVWACLMEIGIFDRNNFSSTEPPDHADDTLVWVYKVTNAQRHETRAVSIEYGYDSTGSSVVVNCWPPLEWQSWPMGVPSATPYLLPAEVENGGTPVS